MIGLSILIPTVTEREALFTALMDELQRQAEPFGNRVEILALSDNKVLPIGTKRNNLWALATTSHGVMFDDDDHPHPHYVSDIMEALQTDPDCVGCIIDMTIDGKPHNQCVHSLQFKTWSNGPVDTPGFGMVYQRNVTHRNPVRTSIARSVKFPDIRFGEDKAWSDEVTKICKTEVFMPRPSFTYRYSTKEKHNEKYGIR